MEDRIKKDQKNSVHSRVSRFEIPASVVPIIGIVITAFFFVSAVTLHFLFKWAIQYNTSYPDIVRQKLLFYLRNTFGIWFLIFSIIEFFLLRIIKLRKIFGKLFRDVPVVLIAFLLSLIMAEGVARFICKERFYIFELQSLYRLSEYPEIFYELRPNASLAFDCKDQNKQIRYCINSLGFRGKEIPLEKRENVIRIITIGDSVTFGIGVDQPEIYSQRLEEFLNDYAAEQGLPVTFQVLNPSGCGWNTFNEIVWLEKRAIKYKPDIILLQFCMNDVDDPLTQMGVTVLYHLEKIPREMLPADYESSNEKSLFVKKFNDITFSEIIHFLGTKYSSLYILALNTYQTLKLEKQAQKKQIPKPLGLSWCLEYLIDENSQQVQWLRRQFKRLRRFSEKHKIPTVVVIFPLSYQLHSEYYRKAIDSLKKYLEEAGLEYIDLTPYFSSVSKHNHFYLYLNQDAVHLNTIGHRFTARVLSSFLRTYPPLVNLLKAKSGIMGK